MAKYLGSLATYSARTVVFGYLVMITVGGILLAIPLSWARSDAPISILDGIFTATSATCVTGLAVRLPGQDFSFFGQLVILALVQVGGVGIMTITTLATLSFGAAEGMRQRTVLSETLGLGGLDSWGILRRIALVTLTIEVLGAIPLFARFSLEMPVMDALYYGVFHSVMAFNNAGFGLRENNLVDYVGDPTINVTVMLLIILGGIGFPAYEDVRRGMTSGRGVHWDTFRLQTKVVVVTTVLLLGLGTVLILILEWNNALANLSPLERVFAAAFQSTTTRTAGFNTLNIQDLTEATLFIMILLMFIGACPCSTGGGVKTTTVAAVVLSAWSRLRGKAEVTIFRRNLSAELTERAIVMILLYIFVATAGITLLLAAEAYNVGHQDSKTKFMDCTFEAFSALGTVGLSTGITPDLSAAGKIVLILLMYIGRIGPITMAVFVSREMRARRVEYAKENLLIG